MKVTFKLGWRAAGIVDNFCSALYLKNYLFKQINKTPFLRNCTYVKQHLKYNEDKTYYFFRKDPWGGAFHHQYGESTLNLKILPMTMFSLMINLFFNYWFFNELSMFMTEFPRAIYKLTKAARELSFGILTAHICILFLGLNTMSLHN